MMAEKQKQKKNEKTPQPLIKCTMCGEDKKIIDDYYASNSVIFKAKKRMCICKDCVVKLFETYKLRFSIDMVAIYEMCRMLDAYFSKSAYNTALNQSENQKACVASIYFQKINSLPQWSGRTFKDSDMLEEDDKVIDNSQIEKDLIYFWGKGFDEEDYGFLENELSNWQKTHKCDNQSEITLLKEICIKILKIRKAREQDDDDSKLQKELQDLMKTASVDPAKANAISGSQTVDRWGVWLKDIEQKKPAEWWEEQEKYKDMDGFIPYIKDYIVRPIKNFFTGVKDFVINGDDLSFKDKNVKGNNNG